MFKIGGGYNRRSFLRHSSALLCSSAILPPSIINAAAPKAAAIKPKITPDLKQYGYGDIRLSAGPLRTQFDHQQALYLGLNVDALLKPFRQRVGLPAPGEDMGGWYDNSSDFFADPKDWSTANFHGYVPGHTFGQYISGLARGYAATRRPATKARIAKLLQEYAKTISGKFFEGYFLPAYTYDKLVVGLIDAYHYCGLIEAKPMLDRLTDAVLPYLPEKALTRPEMAARPHNNIAQTWDESYTLPENLFLAYTRGMGDRYRDLAKRFIMNDTLFTPLSEGKSPLGGLHGYSHVNSLSSAMQSYFVLGEERYLTAAKNGFDFLLRQSFATGGWAPNETLLGPDDKDGLFKSLSNTHNSFETPCGAYGHFKIARSLLQVTGDSHYGDSMERVLYNTILGARPTEADGKTFYYSDYNQTAKKVFHGDKWPCCSGTFIQLTADYGISAYLHDAARICVNLYIPSQLNARIAGQNVALTQETDYPFTNSSRIKLALTSPARFALALRIPAWAASGTKILINGRAWTGHINTGEFATLERTWKSGDTIDIRFDMPVRLEPLNDAHPDLVAVMTGPLVLFPVEDAGPALTRADYLLAKQQGRDAWVIKTKDRTLSLKPFAAIGTESYRLYSQVSA